MFAAGSCTDLEEEVFDELASSTYYQDKNSIIAAITRVYEHAHWTGWDGNRYELSEFTADQLTVTQKGPHWENGGVYFRLHDHTWTAEDDIVNGGWVGPYQGIGQVNIILEDVSNLDYAAMGLSEALKAEHMGELRTLRAWFYLFLIDYFRDVPIVTDGSTLKGNSSPQEVFDFIESELKDIIPGLPKNNKAGRWDQGGAAALLVRLYLNAEKYTGTPKFSECAAVAQDIIDGKYGDYAIDSDYRGPFRSGVNGYRSPENIFEFVHARNFLEFSWMANMTMHYQDRLVLDVNWGPHNGMHLTPSRDTEGNIYDFKLGKPYEKYNDADKRKQPFITTAPGGSYEGFFRIGQQYEFDDVSGFGYDLSKPVMGTEEYRDMPLIYVDQVARFSEGAEGLAKGSHINTGEENSGVRFIKFPWLPESQNLFQFNSAPEIRLAEIYYSLAECKYRAGDIAGAAVLLDAVRERNFAADDWSANSYVMNLSRLDDDEFVDELGREFIGERHRRTDLVRWDRFGNEWWDKAPDTRDRTVFPIPSRQLNANPLLEPNGYE